MYHGTPVFVRTSRVRRVAVSVRRFISAGSLEGHPSEDRDRVTSTSKVRSKWNVILPNVEYPGLRDCQTTPRVLIYPSTLVHPLFWAHKSSALTSIRHFTRSCHVVSPNHHLSILSSVVSCVLQYVRIQIVYRHDASIPWRVLSRYGWSAGVQRLHRFRLNSKPSPYYHPTFYSTDLYVPPEDYDL